MLREYALLIFVGSALRTAISGLRKLVRGADRHKQLRSAPTSDARHSMFTSARYGTLLVLSVVVLTSQVAPAAGLLVADGGAPLEIREHHVSVTINNGIAVTTVTQIFVNSEPGAVSGVFTFPVPARASIAGFSMW